MAQLRLGYPEMQKLNAEVLQVTHSTPAEARLYFRQFPLTFPYLCDPERTVHEAYGIAFESHSPLTGVGNFITCAVTAAGDQILHGERTASPLPYFKRHGTGILRDTPQALFIVDQEGVIRYVHTAGGIGAIPSNTDLARELATL